MKKVMEALPFTELQSAQIPDQEVIQRILAGEKELYEILLRRYNQTLYRVIRTYVHAEVEDVMQEAYIKAYEKLHQFKGGASFSTWLIRIAINVALQFIRKKKRFHVINLYDDKGSSREIFNIPDANKMNPEKRLINQEGRLLIEKAIDQLPKKYKIVYVMRELEGMKNPEIALCLNISESNVKIRVHRAKHLMKDMLYQYSSDVAVFEFGNSSCDRIVKEVMRRIWD